MKVILCNAICSHVRSNDINAKKSNMQLSMLAMPNWSFIL